MWKTQIIKAFNSDALADKVSAALNKLQDSPEVVGTISVQYAAVAAITEKSIPTDRGLQVFKVDAIEYSCMLVYNKVRSFDHLAIPTNETSNT